MAKYNALSLDFKTEKKKKQRVKRKAVGLEQKHKAQKKLQGGSRTKKHQYKVLHKQRMAELEEQVQEAAAAAPVEVKMKDNKPRNKKSKKKASPMEL